MPGGILFVVASIADTRQRESRRGSNSRIKKSKNPPGSHAQGQNVLELIDLKIPEWEHVLYMIFVRVRPP